MVAARRLAPARSSGRHSQAQERTTEFWGLGPAVQFALRRL